MKIRLTKQANSLLRATVAAPLVAPPLSHFLSPLCCPTHRLCVNGKTSRQTLAINKQLIRIIACFTNCRSAFVWMGQETRELEGRGRESTCLSLAYLYCTPSTSQNSNKLLRKIAWRNKKPEKKRHKWRKNANENEPSHKSQTQTQRRAICQVGRSFQFYISTYYVCVCTIHISHTYLYRFVCVCDTCETVLFMVVRCGKLIMRLSHLLALCFAARVCK